MAYFTWLQHDDDDDDDDDVLKQWSGHAIAWRPSVCLSVCL